MVDVLLSAGANPNSGYSRWSPLHAAAVAGNADIVQVLLAAGANPRIHQGWTALHVAAWSGNRAVVQALLGAGADPGRGDEDGRTALHAAAWGANDEVSRGRGAGGEGLLGRKLAEILPKCLTVGGGR